jgi:hypothetical protein
MFFTNVLSDCCRRLSSFLRQVHTFVFLFPFFYQGAVQGPEEFAEGLALGVRSFVGHTVGGTVGALSKITGTVGKGLAALSMDKNYQRRRKEVARRDGNVQTKFMRNLRGFGMVSRNKPIVLQVFIIRKHAKFLACQL